LTPPASCNTSCLPCGIPCLLHRGWQQATALATEIKEGEFGKHFGFRDQTPKTQHPKLTWAFLKAEPKEIASPIIGVPFLRLIFTHSGNLLLEVLITSQRSGVIEMPILKNEKEALKELREKLHKLYWVRDMRVFGSKARGTDVEDSDIDVPGEQTWRIPILM